MEKVQLNIGLTLDEKAVSSLEQLVHTLFPNASLSKTQQKVSREEILSSGKKTSEEEHFLIDTRQVSKLLNISERTICSMRSNGLIPAPIKIGGVVRWSREELKQWVLAGCPSQAEWEELKQVSHVNQQAY